MPDLLLGRDNLLTSILNRLTAGHDVALSSQGIPGVGATALAVAIAHHPTIAAHFPDGVLWASCAATSDGDSSGVSTQDAGACLSLWASALGLDLASCRDVAATAGLLRAWLHDRRMLLVIDSPGFDDATWLHCGGPACAHLAVTHDDARTGDLAKPSDLFDVPPLADDIALELMRILAPQAAHDEPQLLEQVTRLAGGIPLALHLLGAYLAAPEPSAVENLITTPRSAVSGQAIELTSVQRRLLLARQRLGMGDQPYGQSSATLQRTIALCVAALPGAALHAFRCMGAFATAPYTFNSAAVQAVSQCDEQLVERLVSRHLLEVWAWDPSSVAGHAPLHPRTRAEWHVNRLTSLDARLMIRASVAGTARVRGDTQAVDRHREHYRALARACREQGMNVEAEYGQIRHACATLPDGPAVLEFAWAMQHYQARHNLWLEQQAWIKRTLLPAAQVSTALPAGSAITYPSALEMIGSACDALGQPHQAIAFYQRALNQYELNPDSGDPVGIGRTLHQLALVYEHLGQHEQAIALLHNALPALTKGTAPDRSSAASIYTTLGTIYNDAGHYAQAVDTLQHALSIYDDPASAHNGDTASLVNTLDQMGKACSRLGRYSQARSYLHRALENRERALPTDQAGLASALCELGMCYTALRQYDLALVSLQRARGVQEKLATASPAQGSSGMGRVLNALGELYQSTGKLDQALSNFQHALPMCEDANDREGIAQSCMGIGLVMSGRARRDEAMSLLQRALSIEEAAEPAGAGWLDLLAHSPEERTPPVQQASVQQAPAQPTPVPSTHLATVLNHVGALYLDRNDPSRALAYLQRALYLRENGEPGDQTSLAQTLNNLGAAYTKLNQPEQAAQCLDRTLGIYAQLGDGAGEAAARCNLALLNLLLGKYDQAVTSMARAVELDKEISSPDLPSHEALLARIVTERATRPHLRSTEAKSSILERLRKGKA